MTRRLQSALICSALLLTTGMSQAATVVFDPLSAGDDTVTTAGSSNYLAVDVNQDGNTDLSLGIQASAFGGAFVRGVDLPTPDVSGEEAFRGFEAAYQEVTLSQTLFGAGDVINADTFGTPDNNIFLYGRGTSSAENILPNVGDSAFFGVRIQTGTALYQDFDGVFTDGFLDGAPIETIFGFIEISHGSVVVGSVGYNNDAISSITVPGGDAVSAVPLPASAVLMLGALGGLGAVRRKSRG